MTMLKQHRRLLSETLKSLAARDRELKSKSKDEQRANGGGHGPAWIDYLMLAAMTTIACTAQAHRRSRIHQQQHRDGATIEVQLANQSAWLKNSVRRYVEFWCKPMYDARGLCREFFTPEVQAALLEIAELHAAQLITKVA